MIVYVHEEKDHLHIHLWVTCWCILHSVQTCLFILGPLLQHELPKRLEKSLGTLQGKGFSTKCLSLGGSRLSHMPISEYQEEEVQVEVEEEEQEEGEEQQQTTGIGGDGGRGGGRSCLFRTDTERHFMKQVLNI